MAGADLLTINPDKMSVEPVSEKELVDDPEVLWDQIETALIGYLNEARQTALAQSGEIKKKWAIHWRMWDGKLEDDPDDVLTELGVYQPLIARLADVFISSLMNNLIPTPADMDFFELRGKWAGLEKYAENLTALLREKFKTMRPDGAENGFLDILDTMLTDWCIIGNTVGIVTQESIYGDEDEYPQILSGPTVQVIDPRNVWPIRIDVDSIHQTDTIIYDPITEYDLEDGNYLNVGQVVEKETRCDLPNIDSDAPGSDGNYSTNDISGRYRRYLYLGHFPVKEIRHRMGDNVSEEDIWMASSSKYGFDMATSSTRKWWNLSWVGDTIIECRPFPIALPIGRGPLIHERFIKKPGQLWGKSIYDRVEWDERLINFFNRALVMITSKMADPPMEYYKFLIEREWLQLHGENFSLESGMRIPKLPNQMSQKVLEPLVPEAGAVPVLTEQMRLRDQIMREAVGVTSAVEGKDRSDTATQNANNLAQSLNLLRYYEKRLEHGLLREIVVRCYVTMQQAMTITQQPEMIPVSSEERAARSAIVRPEHVLDETLIDVTMTGMNSPLNKYNQLERMEKYIALWLPTGLLDGRKAMQMHGQMLLGSSASTLEAQLSPEDAMAMIQNVAAALGAQGAGNFMSNNAIAGLQGGIMGGANVGQGMPAASTDGNGNGQAGNPAGRPVPIDSTGPAGLPMSRGTNMRK